jgi:hypothetical protein
MPNAKITRQQIEDFRPLFGPFDQLAMTVIGWKQLCWDGRTAKGVSKQSAIENLSSLLENRHGTNVCVAFTNKISHGCYYDRKIYLNKDNPSIMTFFHELAHRIHGDNELLACAWSTQLFKLVFPKEYAKLKWDNGIMKKG